MTRELQMSRQEAIDILRCRKDGNAVDALEVLIRLAEDWDKVIENKERKKEKQAGRFYSKELLEQANKPIQIIGYHDNNNDFSKYMKGEMK